jgi:hypothetical protein
LGQDVERQFALVEVGENAQGDAHGRVEVSAGNPGGQVDRHAHADPQMMLISHKPKLAPATLSAATQPVPKKISSAVPRNSAMHWLESDGCCKAVVMENLDFVVVWRLASSGQARFSPGGSPSPTGLLLESVSLFLQDSETKKYRQETLLSKVESEPSVTLLFA